MTEPQPPRDPWKSFRGVMSGVLLLEAVVVLLALPVVMVVGHAVPETTGTYLIVVAAVLVVLPAFQRRPWAIWLNLAIQVVLLAGFFVDPAIGFIGVLFTAVWLLLAYLRSEVLRKQKRGLLPGQQQPGESVD
jgi:predicted membrane protein